MAASAECKYEQVPKAPRGQRLWAWRGRPAKSLAAAALSLGLVGAALAWSRGRKSLPLQVTRRNEVELDQFHNFPGDCPQVIKLEGCEKKRWSCEEDDFTIGWKCCCHSEIWHIPPKPYDQQVQPDAFRVQAKITPADDMVLRLQQGGDLCLASSGGSVGSHFTYAKCSDSNTRVRLPASGSGSIQMASTPGACLGIPEGSMVNPQVSACDPASMLQRFQLTEGNRGMVQWAHAGSKCLDSETDSAEAGAKIRLADCAYWPKKRTQNFRLEQAPKQTSKEKENDEGEHDEKDPKREHTLFCTSVMLPWTYEVDMLRAQLAYKKGVGIFACDEWAVYSNERVKLKDGATPEEDVYNDVMNGTLRAKIGGSWNTALNTPIFRRFWKALMADPRASTNEWIVKADPDCVFFPNRLKEMITNRWPVGGKAGKPVWLQNCQLGLHGPIEVINQQAFAVYTDRWHECDEVAEKHGQEDVYMGHCMNRLGVPKVDALNLLLEADWACNERPSSRDLRPPCFDQQVSFHPFKTVKSYFKCYKEAEKMWWYGKFYPQAHPPGPENQHHA